MSRYAEGTSVSVEKSRAEIEATLTRYGATAFAYAWQGSEALIEFAAKNRRIRFKLPLPHQDEERFQRDGRGSLRSPEKRRVVWEQACRQSWRALALVIKAKLEAVAAGITEFEDEFLANIVMPDGQTVGQHTKPTIKLAYENHTMTKLLPDYTARPI
ncbi:MAG: hypothetical protein JO051_06370 [Acidobacteriaceae bacterium]|nr:hypothetical protein [Acidobacteriaceae bacterium]